MGGFRDWHDFFWGEGGVCRMVGEGGCVEVEVEVGLHWFGWGKRLLGVFLVGGGGVW